MATALPQPFQVLAEEESHSGGCVGIALIAVNDGDDENAIRSESIKDAVGSFKDLPQFRILIF